MAKYYDDGGNCMSAQDWEEVDRSSREILSCFLETKLSAENIGESHGNVCWDLSCVVNGKRVAVEVKDRGYDHDRFGDILVEDSKQECISKKDFDAALAVNVFKDGVLCAASLFDGRARHFRKKAPVTTLVKGALHDYIWKEFTSLPQRLKVRFRRDADGWNFRKIC